MEGGEKKIRWRNGRKDNHSTAINCERTVHAHLDQPLAEVVGVGAEVVQLATAHVAVCVCVWLCV